MTEMTEDSQSCYSESNSVALAKVRKRPLEKDALLEEIHAKHDRLVFLPTFLYLLITGKFCTADWGFNSLPI